MTSDLQDIPGGHKPFGSNPTPNNLPPTVAELQRTVAWDGLSTDAHRALDKLCALASRAAEPAPAADDFPALRDLVARFSAALLDKLISAEKKYGHNDAWIASDWEGACSDRLRDHIAKGDPRDVAAYCAFMWHHGWSTRRASAPAHVASAGKMVPVLYWLDAGKFARAMLVGHNQLVVDLTSGDGPSVIGKPHWFDAGYVSAFGGLVPEIASEGNQPGQWSYGVAELPAPYPETSKRLGDYAQALGILSAIHPGIDTARIASAPVECAREIIDFVAKERRAPRDDGLRKAIVLVEGMQTDAIDEMRDYSQGSEDRRDLQLESNTLAIVAEKLRKLLAESHAADAGESTPRDDGRMRKLRDEVLGYAVDCERPDVSEAFSLADVKARAWAYRFVVNKIDKLLAESPASDATLSVERDDGRLRREVEDMGRTASKEAGMCRDAERERFWSGYEAACARVLSLLAESPADDVVESTPRDDGRLRKAIEAIERDKMDTGPGTPTLPRSELDRATNSAYNAACDNHIFILRGLLAESTAADAPLSVEREYEAMVKLIRETHNGYNPEARKSMGIEEPESAIVALHELVKEQKSLEGYEIRDLRTRLQAVETERDAMAKERDEANAKTLRELEASREHMLNSLNWKHQRDELRAAQPQPAATSEPLRESATIVRPATVRQGDEDDEKSCPYCGRSNRFHDTDCETAHVWKHFDARLRALEGQ